MRPHGYARYRLDGCRCYVCAFARSQYDERRGAMIAAGTWHPFTDITVVQEHLRKLKALGMGDRQIASLAGVERKCVRDIWHGFRHDSSRGNPVMSKVRTRTASAILAVDPDPLDASDGTYVPAADTWRRIDRLLAHGLTKARISAEIGQGGRALQLRRTRVSAANARAVHALYLREFGEGPRRRDDVDWVVVERVVAGERLSTTAAERRQVVATLHGLGLSDGQIAKRTGWTDKTAFRIRHELDLGAVA